MRKQMTRDLWVPLPDAARAMHITYVGAYQHAMSGKIEAVRPPSGRGWIVSMNSVRAYIRRRAQRVARQKKAA